MKKLTHEERLARLADRAEDARVNALYTVGAMGRQVPQPPAPEPPAYVVTTLPSALTRKAAAQKAARTRRLNRQVRGD